MRMLECDDLPLGLVLLEYFSVDGSQYPPCCWYGTVSSPLCVVSQHSRVDEAAEVQLLRPELRHDRLGNFSNPLQQYEVMLAWFLLCSSTKDFWSLP